MNHDLREFCRAVAPLGWSLGKPTENGHQRLVHRNGAEYVMASTPSDHRSRKNALAALERLCGQKLARPNHRKGRTKAASSGGESEPQREARLAAYFARIEREAKEREAREAVRKRESELNSIANLMQPGGR